MNIVRCAHSFNRWSISNPHYSKVYELIGSPRPFDVTLFDAMFFLNNSQSPLLNTNKKIQYYHDIITEYKPENIEIGLIACKKTYPIFKDTIKFNKSIIEYNLNMNLLCQDYMPNCFITIPNEYQFNNVFHENTSIQNFSFITSISKSFQFKNTKMTLSDSFKDINNFGSKLYVSCINECPIDGKMNNDYVVDRLIELIQLKADIICLSDTCGTLHNKDFKYIIQKTLKNGINPKKLCLHMYVDPNCEKNTEKIFHIALDHGINNFNVSAFNFDGFLNNAKNSNIFPTLQYELYYKFLQSYIIGKTD
jgi:hypothetical protein